MFRRVVAIIVLLCAAVLAAIAVWPQLFGVQRLPFAAQAVSLRGAAITVALFMLIVLTLLAIVGRRARRFWGALGILVAVFCIVSVAVLAMRGFGDSSFHKKGPYDITVLSWNTLGDVPGARAIARLALESDADIVSLPETTSETAIEVADLMRMGGKPMWAHTFHYDLISKARSTSLLTSIDLGNYRVDADHRTTNVLPSIVATPVNGDGPTIVAVHAVAPIPSELNHWKLDLTWLAEACARSNVIMAGDFNSTLDHFDGLAVSDGAAIGNCVDAGAVTGNAAVGTWPTSVPPLLGAPIDHVMATPGWSITGMRVVTNWDGSGSDHRPIVVQLSPRR